MNLENYIHQSLNKAVLSPATIELPRNLFDALAATRDTSETAGVEYGRNLYFRDATIRWSNEIRGTKEATDLNTDVERTNREYLGDFHVHPYYERLGPTASIGPSITDIQEILNRQPVHLPVGIYFVFAGQILHLMILTRDTEQFDAVDMRSFTPDRSTVQALQGIKHIDGKHKFHTMKPKPVPDTDPGYIQSLRDERAASKQLKNYEYVFHNANLGMNQRAARLWEYEYYVADLDSANNKQSLTTDDGRISCLRQRQAGDSPSAGIVCACCGKIHGRTSGGYFGQWHKCRKCKAIYCDWCGDMLWRPGWFIGRERTCGVQGCGGRTLLFS